MKSRHLINNQRFSISLCNVAKQYGFKTVGQMHKTLKTALPSAKWSYNNTSIRTNRLITELNDYLTTK